MAPDERGPANGAMSSKVDRLSEGTRASSQPFQITGMDLLAWGRQGSGYGCIR